MTSTPKEESRDISHQGQRKPATQGNCEYAGVTVKGILDKSADITIMNGDALKKVAAVSRHNKKALKAADKTPVGYDNQPF